MTNFTSRIGLTTTIPIEVLYAAKVTPVDLNNIFITSKDPLKYVQQAEYDGYPRNVCGWIKGLYSITLESGIRTVVAVVEGDCSQTQAMMETLEMHGVDIIPFAFPYGRDRDLLRLQIEKLMARFGVGWNEVNAAREYLHGIRRKVHEIDRMTWQDNLVSGRENHYYQVCCSDFNSDPRAFEREVDSFLLEARSRKPREGGVRIGYIGIPPIFTDFYEFLESLGVRVVFNEVQRQFSMPFETDDLVEQYALYTYPYNVFGRLADIKREVSERKIDALIHYTQNFCFRQIQDLIIRREIDIPILTLEGESPVKLDARTKVRIESFIEMLKITNM